MECECISIKYACERNRLYLLGRSFSIFNDHKPIVNLLNKSTSVLPLRIESMLLSIQGYDLKLPYVKSQENIADYTSRDPFEKASLSPVRENYINFVATLATPNAIRLDKIKEETKKDNFFFLQCIIQLIIYGHCYILDEPQNHSHLQNINIADLKHYRSIKTELTVSQDNFEK